MAKFGGQYLCRHSSELVAAGRLYRRKGDTRPTTTGSSASVLRVVEMVERNGNDAGEG